VDVVSSLRLAPFAARPSRRLVTGVLALGTVAVLVSGCADFSDSAAPTNWQPAQTFAPEAAPNPELPGESPGPGSQGASPGGQQNPASVPPPDGCKDFHQEVIATCLNPVTAVAALPGTDANPVGLAAERTGQIVKVQSGQQPAPVATLSVDSSTDGGLTGLALSPTYAQDQLIFAYITTPTDNRIVRIAPGDTPKPILTGIPRGSTDNRGVLSLDHKGALLVATGDAGNPQAASDPTSLAGKVLRIDVNGAPAPGNPNPASVIVASGLTDPGGVCSSADGSRAWVTDRTKTQDVLYKLNVGKPLGSAAWSWPDKPGVAGCVSFPSSVMIATSTAGNAQSLSLNADGSFAGSPQVSLAGASGYGRLGGLDLIGDSAAMAGTVNKDGGQPVSSDDRVVLILGASSPGGGQD
jgi:glucose/arabinose dehydrogenase